MIEKRRLGRGDVEVGAMALGAMGFAGFYSGSDDGEGVRAIRRALDAGIMLIDTAEAYGRGRSESMVGRAVRDRRDEAVVATKASRGAPEYLHAAIDRSLAHLGLDHVDRGARRGARPGAGPGSAGRDGAPRQRRPQPGGLPGRAVTRRSERLDAAFPPGVAAGERYPREMMAALGR